VQECLLRVGVEKPSKAKLEKFFSLSEWNKNRNAAAHPEKRHKLSLDAIDSLDKVRRSLDIWLLLTDFFQESTEPD